MNKKSKRGQVTLFIILAVVIVTAVLVGYLTYKDYQIKRQEKINLEIAAIKISVESCLETATIEALDFIGIHGGFYNIKENFLSYFDTYLPFYYSKGKKTMPSKEKIAEELSLYISENAFYCIQKQASKENFYVSFDSNITKVIISEKVTVKTSKANLKKGDINIILKEISIAIPFRLNDIYDKTDLFIDKEVSDPGYLHLSYLIELFDEDFMINVLSWGEGSKVITIQDNSESTISIFKKPYIFIFANKY